MDQEPEVLLSMYRDTYNDFLEAYKELMNKNKALTSLVEGVINLEQDENNKKDLKQQLESIREV